MTNEQIRRVRLAQHFMPKLWDFASPRRGLQWSRARRVAFKAWCFAFRVRVQLLDW